MPLTLVYMQSRSFVFVDLTNDEEKQCLAIKNSICNWSKILESHLLAFLLSLDLGATISELDVKPFATAPFLETPTCVSSFSAIFLCD